DLALGLAKHGDPFRSLEATNRRFVFVAGSHGAPPGCHEGHHQAQAGPDHESAIGNHALPHNLAPDLLPKPNPNLNLNLVSAYALGVHSVPLLDRKPVAKINTANAIALC